MPGKECPMCGEMMRLREAEITNQVPGTLRTSTTQSRQWICPECDYFEEMEDGEDQ
jgi:predicted RNA-binding Zn-ribbon protein involved in translation (DUF1610 family)